MKNKLLKPFLFIAMKLFAYISVALAALHKLNTKTLKQPLPPAMYLFIKKCLIYSVYFKLVYTAARDGVDEFVEDALSKEGLEDIKENLSDMTTTELYSLYSSTEVVIKPKGEDD